MNLFNYKELIGLTLQYILQEYAMNDWVIASSSEYQFFKEIALKQKHPPKQESEKIPPPKNVQALKTSLKENTSIKGILPLPAAELKIEMKEENNRKENFSEESTNEKQDNQSHTVPEKRKFLLEPLKDQCELESNSEWEHLFKEIFPHIPLRKIPLEDVFKSSCVYLFYSSTILEEQQFLYKITEAIQKQLCNIKCMRVSELAQKDHFSNDSFVPLIIVDNVKITQEAFLQKFLEKNPNCLLVLENITTLKNDVKAKTALWNELKQRLMPK